MSNLKNARVKFTLLGRIAIQVFLNVLVLTLMPDIITGAVIGTLRWASVYSLMEFSVLLGILRIILQLSFTAIESHFL